MVSAKATDGVQVPPGTVAASAQLLAEPTSVLAAAASRRLAKLVGEATELIMKLESVSASGTLVEMLNSALASLKAQYTAVQAFANAKIDNAEMYLPYSKATDAIVEYYQNKKQFADALIRVGKSQAEPKPSSPAKAAPPAKGPSP